MNYLFKRAVTFFLTLFLCVICNLFIFGQAINNQIKDVVMPSPNAASLGKYGDIPVSYNTGVPSIGVPIHTITEGSISLPISLSYHAGGLKVGEPCSWVGTGWSLQAGGIISRTIQGRADERENGYFSMGKLVNVFTNGQCIQSGDTWNAATSAQLNGDLAAGLKDGEPDLFSFSVGGYSGKFYIDADKTDDGVVNGKVVIVPKQDIRITYSVVSGFGDKSLKQFTMTTPNGIKYEFGDILGDGVGIEISKPSNSYANRYASNWYLRKITSTDGKNVINLNYVREIYQYAYRSAIATNGLVQTPQGGYYQSFVTMMGYRLNTITTPTETVTFIAGLARQDIKTNVDSIGSITDTAKVLSAIQITNGTTTCKRFELTQSYFEDLSSTKSGQYTDKRLKLESVQEKSCMGTADISIPPHTFTYYGQSEAMNYLPNTLSPAFDHWGYYNDARTNPSTGGTNIPYTRLKFKFGGSGPQQDERRGMSNRETNEEAMKWGTIQKITYPTGGSTTFEFEANTVWDPVGEKALQTVGVVERLWTEGGGCYTDNLNNPPAANASMTAAPFTAEELNNSFVKWGKKTVPSNISCGIPTTTGFLTVKVFDATTSAFIGSFSYIDTATRYLTDIMAANNFTLSAGVSYRFSMYGQNFGGQLTIQKEITVLQNTNRKVGGLRIKKLINSNGISSANDVVKTYQYGTTLSTGFLYQKPIYGYVYKGMVGDCNNIPLSYYENGFFFESPIVPLSSFEGNHLNYNSVQENYVVNGVTKYYTTYEYSYEPLQTFSGIPVVPIQPRIGSGELLRKGQWSDSGVEVASETNTAYNDAYNDISDGKFIKFNSYSSGSGGTPISFWSYYKIRNRPYRLAQTVSVVDGITSTTTYAYDNLNRFLAPTEVTSTNSDGVTQTSKTYYAHNLPSTHPNFAIQSTFINKFMIAVPLQQEIYVTGNKRGGCVLEYKTFATADEFYPHKSYSINRDGSLKLAVTVDAYANGLPTQMTKAGFWISQNYDWDSQKRLSTKDYYQFNWAFTYKGTSDLVSQTKDENSFKNTFEYDNLMRLTTTKSYFANIPDNTLRSTTTNIYNYGGAAGATNNYIENSTQFEGIADPLSSKQVVDGLGRPVQTIKKDYNGAGQHVSNYVTYDALGRQDRVYQPFVTTTYGYLAAPPSNTPYTYTQYEASPLSRPLRQYAEDNTFKAMTYGKNATEDAVRIGNSSTSIPSFYAANELYKTTVTDENNKSTCVFKDKLGRVVLTRKFLGSDKIDTYNIYDFYGQLVAVLPPGSVNSDGSVIQSLIFKYTYDNKNRLIEKQIPGADPQRFYYDNRDLVALTQDGNMRAANANKYMATLYDDYGRVVKVGFIITSDPSVKATSIQYAEMDNNNTVIEQGYSQNQAHLKNMPPNGYVWAVGTINPNVNDPSSGDRRIMFRSKQYNAKGEFDWGCPEYLNMNNCSDAVYNSAGKPIQQVSYNNLKTNGSLYQMFYTQQFEYDKNLRPTITRQQLWGPNGGQAFDNSWHNLSAVQYNHLDQVTEKNIGSNRWNDNTYLQSIDYTYNVRGWLTGINQVNLTQYNEPIVVQESGPGMPTPESGMGTYTPLLYGNDTKGDLFGQVIKYGNPDALSSNVSAPTPQYNGNISQTMWQVSGRERQAYNYTYDDLDRLLEGKYYDLGDDDTFNAGVVSTDNKFGEALTYDKRGNILTLNRNGMTGNCTTPSRGVCGTFAAIDNLVYTYNDKNQVTKITDGSNTTIGFKASNINTDQYTYDANGNIKSDRNKNIVSIAYNFLNLPETITFGYTQTDNSITYFGKIEFVYDAFGTKMRKTSTILEPNGQPKNTSWAVQVTDYMGEYEYKNKVLSRIHNTEGAAVRQSNGSFVYEYSLKDHLGNTRVTFADTNGDWNIDPNTEISQINHYYPFGLNMEGNWNGQNGANKTQYNGKEWNDDFGLGWNDYGARWYDPAIGRFPMVDPLSEMYSNINPYAYVMNNPIILVDPTGMASEAYTSIDQANRNREKSDQAAENFKKTDSQRYNSITSDDIAESGTGTPYGHYALNERTGERSDNVVEGFNFTPNDHIFRNGAGEVVGKFIAQGEDRFYTVSTSELGTTVRFDHATFNKAGLGNWDALTAQHKSDIRNFVVNSKNSTIHGLGARQTASDGSEGTRNNGQKYNTSGWWTVMTTNLMPIPPLADGKWTMSGTNISGAALGQLNALGKGQFVQIPLTELRFNPRIALPAVSGPNSTLERSREVMLTTPNGSVINRQ